MNRKYKKRGIKNRTCIYFFFFEMLLFGIYLYKNLNMADIERKKREDKI